jgi:hypothetical protein
MASAGTFNKVAELKVMRLALGLILRGAAD